MLVDRFRYTANRCRAVRDDRDQPARTSRGIRGVSLNLRARIVLIYLVIVLLIVGSAVLISVKNMTEALDAEYLDKATTIARAFESHYCSLAEIEDSSVTQGHIDRLVGLNPNIHRLSLFVPAEGRVTNVASSDPGQINAPATASEAEPIYTGRTTFRQEMSAGGARLLEVLAPVRLGGRPVAAIRVDLLLAPRDEAIHGQALHLASIGFVATSLLLVSLYLSLDWLVLVPLSRLEAATQAIGRGLLGTRVALRRNDELGRVAEAFNGMAGSLEKREAENEELRRQLLDKYDQAQMQASTDPITGLYNRRHFQTSLANELERADRFGTPVTLLFVDVDHFKIYNDTFGHQHGDEALRDLAALLSTTLREIDVVARYGGEEFAIILPRADSDGSWGVAERIRRVVAEHDFGSDRGRRVALTVSVGVASYPEDGHSSRDLIEKADRAMYWAKQSGRDQVRTYRQLLEVARVP